jgi:molybdenum cofactor cytidylyltransferase
MPKQLLEFNGNILINIIGKIASGCDVKEIVCVLGANSEEIKSRIAFSNIKIIYAEEWQNGINESIKVGLNYFREDINSILFLLCDQYAISTDLLNKIIAKSIENPEHIIACKYSEGFGIPALFPKKYFSEINNLGKDIGCKKIIKNNLDNIVFIDFYDGYLDIDTLDDYESAKLLLIN